MQVETLQWCVSVQPRKVISLQCLQRCVQRCVCPELAGLLQSSSPLEDCSDRADRMFAAALIVVGAASAAMVAAVKRGADLIVEAVEKVETAVYHYSDAVGSAERRQDKRAGIRSDVARHIVQAVVQYDRAHSALWLQRRLQSAMESAVRGALLVGADRQLHWRMQVFEAKLQIMRDFLQDAEDRALRNGADNLAALQRGDVGLFAGCWPSMRAAEWAGLQNNQSLQNFGCMPMKMQIHDRLVMQEPRDGEGSSAKLAAVQKCRAIL